MDYCGVCQAVTLSRELYIQRVDISDCFHGRGACSSVSVALGWMLDFASDTNTVIKKLNNTMPYKDTRFACYQNDC